MTTPISCGTCVNWSKHPHSQANWGVCIAITKGQCDSAALNIITLHKLEAHAELLTRDVFYCSHFELKPQTQQYSIVDAAREAARRFKGKTTG